MGSIMIVIVFIYLMSKTTQNHLPYHKMALFLRNKYGDYDDRAMLDLNYLETTSL